MASMKGWCPLERDRGDLNRRSFRLKRINPPDTPENKAYVGKAAFDIVERGAITSSALKSCLTSCLMGHLGHDKQDFVYFLT